MKNYSFLLDFNIQTKIICDRHDPTQEEIFKAFREQKLENGWQPDWFENVDDFRLDYRDSVEDSVEGCDTFVLYGQNACRLYDELNRPFTHYWLADRLKEDIFDLKAYDSKKTKSIIERVLEDFNGYSTYRFLTREEYIEIQKALLEHDLETERDFFKMFQDHTFGVIHYQNEIGERMERFATILYQKDLEDVPVPHNIKKNLRTETYPQDLVSDIKSNNTDIEGWEIMEFTYMEMSDLKNYIEK